MDINERIELITRWPTEEVLTINDLRELIETGTKLKHYIGFEISGRLHIGSGIGCMMKVVDLQRAGVNCNVFLADWHAWINNKLGGNINNIKKAVEYYKEAFKAGIKALGGNPDKVGFITGSELYHNNDDYWRTVIDVSKNVSIGRIMRSITILGRKEKELTSFAQLIYPPMQVADIFTLGVNIAQAGTDQRKAHVVAREVANKLSINKLVNKSGETIKPVALHHHLWLGLQKPSVWPIPSNINKQELIAKMKMSKSKPNTAVFVNDSPEEIKKKIMNAFCPEKIIDFNPIIDWLKSIGFRNGPLRIKRPEKFGGELVLEDYDELISIYSKGKLHPLDLKKTASELIIKLLEPVRNHFKNKQSLIRMFNEFNITR